MTLSPDQVISKDAFEAFRKRNYPKLSADEAFERFSVGEITLRHRKLDTTSVENGIVGSRDDGGVDGFYVFLNGQELIEPDSVRLSRKKDALSGLQSGLTLDVILTQSKNETSWDTNVFPKIESALKAILDPRANAQSLREFPLNTDVVEKSLMLKKLREKLSHLVPVMSFTVQYVTFASEVNIEPYMNTKRLQLSNWLDTKLPSGSTVEVSYVGDSSIVKRLRESHDFKAKLIFAKAPVRMGRALVGLVKIEDYINFLHDGNTKTLRDQLFAVNVRDYAGNGTGVNRAITETLNSDTPTEFWWLNNGITILADDASDPIELEWIATNPMIVNGLQTSYVIAAEANSKRITKARRGENLLVRLIIESDPSIRESIISGTNNQTAISGIQLHANEEKQFRIEEYLRHSNWYYERRRYQYKGTATPAARIRTVTDLAQAVISYRLHEPDIARARPGSLLKSNRDWKRVFRDDESEDLYLKAIEVASSVELYLKTTEAKLISQEPTNNRQYLVCGFALLASGVKDLKSFDKIPSVQLKSAPTQEQLKKLHLILLEEVNKLDDGKVARDKIFKGSKLKDTYFRRIFELNGAV